MASRGGKSAAEQGGSTSSGKKQKSQQSNTTAAASASTLDQPQEDPLVAVILADSYDDHFAPLTISGPRCLLPMANVPLLHYSIESASRTGVDHVFILTRTHGQLIKQHVQDKIQDMLKAQGIAITVISTPEAQSEGDALRELDAKQILRSDFLLFKSDSLCTLDLTSVLNKHKKRRLADKDAIMTVCCTLDVEHAKVANQHACFIDPTNAQLLHYQPMTNNTRPILPVELLRLDEKSGCEEIDIRTNVVESGVYICSMEVPPLFSENFDYQSLTTDFIPGILTSDLLDSKIFVHITKHNYARRAMDTQSYSDISRDILQRWTYPLVPSSSAWIGKRVTERKGWRYIGQNVQCDRTCDIQPLSMISEGCRLAVETIVSASVLCENVQVAKRSKIHDSHLHSNVTIGENVGLSHCIIGSRARILNNVKLGRGCLIGADCIIGPDVTLSPGTRVGIKSMQNWQDEEEEDDDDENSSQDVERDDSLGLQSKGVRWPNIWQDVKESDDDEEANEPLKVQRLRAIGYVYKDDAGVSDDDSTVSSIEIDSELESDIGDGESSGGIENLAHERGVTNLTLADQGQTQLEKSAATNRLVEFETEARASLLRALDEQHSIENTTLELKTLRMASNVAPREVHKVVLQTLLDKCDPTDAKQIQSLIMQWSRLIPQVQMEDQLYTLVVVQVYCSLRTTRHALFVPLMKLFYNQDIISDDAILSWYQSKASQQSNAVQDQSAFIDLRTRAKGIVQYVHENQQDDDDDDDEEEDDDSEEE